MGFLHVATIIVTLLVPQDDNKRLACTIHKRTLHTVKYMTRPRLRIVPKTHHYIRKVTSTEQTIVLETWE
jgi:hypothetical protein